jgi:hypothetical protein
MEVFRNMSGKNFSLNNMGQRKANDMYETPYSMTAQFLDLLFINPFLSTLEPASGNGAIVKELEKFKFKSIVHYDLNKDGTNFL